MIKQVINALLLKPVYYGLRKRAVSNLITLNDYIMQLAVCPELAKTLYGKSMELLNEITKMQVEMMKSIMPLSKYWK